MAKEGKRAKLVKCPYFHSEEKQRHFIRCEGIGDALYTEINFSGREEQRILQMRVFCQSTVNCRKCELHRMIEQSKYGE